VLPTVCCWLILVAVQICCLSISRAHYFVRSFLCLSSVSYFVSCIGFLTFRGIELSTLVTSWPEYFSFGNSFVLDGDFGTAAKYFNRNLRLPFPPSGRRFRSFNLSSPSGHRYYALLITNLLITYTDVSIITTPHHSSDVCC
jgi:hypothetical protein